MWKLIFAAFMAIAYIMAVFDAVVVRNVPVWRIILGSLAVTLIYLGFVVAVEVSLWRHRQNREIERRREEADNYF